jgi:hypothetical protein
MLLRFNVIRFGSQKTLGTPQGQAKTDLLDCCSRRSWAGILGSQIRG